MNDAHLGQGLSFPLRLGVRGLGESTGMARIEQSMRMILGTQYGERLMRPIFGANLKSLIFGANNATTASLAAYYVKDALDRWEPRIDVLDVLVTNDIPGNQLVIEVRYRLRATADEQLFVLPFALEHAS
jgi:phage baseplate assembly protein W